jgi:hypothetical protein
MRVSILGAAVVLVVVCSAQEEKPYAVLPASEARQVFVLVNGRSARAEEGWTPQKAEIDSLEAHLDEIAKLKPRCCVPKIADARSSYRQYVGIVVGGRRLIYVNAFAPDLLPKDWQSRLVIVWDGGGAYWRVAFDPATATFSDLETNGFG